MQRLKQVQGSLVGLFQDLERLRSHAARAEQGVVDPTQDCSSRVRRSESSLSIERGAHVREDSPDRERFVRWWD
jgi:hypothetical protein